MHACFSPRRQSKESEATTQPGYATAQGAAIPKPPEEFGTRKPSRSASARKRTQARMHAMAAGSGAAAPAPTRTTTSRVSATRTKLIPSTLVPAAVLLAVAVAVLSLLPSVAQAMWELPHLFLLGLVISYGVFAGQKNGAAGGDDGGPAADAAKDGAARAWNSRYHPDDPLVVVADQAAGSDGQGYASGERPFSLPVRRLKPVAEESSETGGASDDNGVGEETGSCASSTAGFWAGALAAPSPPSVLDAFNSREFNAATPATMSKGFRGYDDSLLPPGQAFNDDGEEEEAEDTDWDEEADGPDEMTASSEMSFPGDFVACGNRRYSCDGDGESVDEELLELAAKAGPEGEDEVDRKADEFIAKFREQIRLQRL